MACEGRGGEGETIRNTFKPLNFCFQWLMRGRLGRGGEGKEGKGGRRGEGVGKVMGIFLCVWGRSDFFLVI